jgi:hypothetical protein
MTLISFKTRHGRVSFKTKTRKARKGGKRKVRRGSWPKGKTPAHLKKFLFR